MRYYEAQTFHILEVLEAGLCPYAATNSARHTSRSKSTPCSVRQSKRWLLKVKGLSAVVSRAILIPPLVGEKP